MTLPVPPSNFRKNPRVAECDRVTELVDRARLRMPDAIGNLMDARAGHPRAQSYDRETGSGPSPWCWDHQQTVFACDRQDHLCGGEVIEVHDPTGEAAINGDPARADIARLDKGLRLLAQGANLIADVVGLYAGRGPTDADRREVDRDNHPGCQSCARIDSSKDVARWEPVAKKRTDAKGNLGHPYDLCQWCYRFTLDTGRLPHMAELQSHHEGSKVKRPA